LNKKILAFLTVILIVAVISGGYAISPFIMQPASEPEPTPTHTPSATLKPEPPPEPTPTGETEFSHIYVVYEWYLKVEYINNETWLSNAYYNYTADQAWFENYKSYLESMYYSTFPPDRLFPPGCYINLFVNSDFNTETGWTKAVYRYAAEPHYSYWSDGSLNYNHYSVETALPMLADNRGWTKTFI
jgi:hypothetical protein